MSDLHLHDDSHVQDWQGGPDITRLPSQEAPGDERAAAYADIEATKPPLLGASIERLQLCRDAIAITLLEAGIPVRQISRLAALCVVRLQEPLDR